MNILLVEDNKGDIQLTQMAFMRRKLSSALAVVHDGVEALEYLSQLGPYRESIQPDLILLDLNMPRMGGLQLLEIIKQDERFKIIPVIILTSSSAPADIRICYEHHANCYILKPFDLEKFMDMTKMVEDFWAKLTQLPEKTSYPEKGMPHQKAAF